jgi:hypothetical protein
LPIFRQNIFTYLLNYIYYIFLYLVSGILAQDGRLSHSRRAAVERAAGRDDEGADQPQAPERIRPRSKTGFDQSLPG